MENLLATSQVLGTLSAINNETGNWCQNKGFQNLLIDNNLIDPNTIEELEFLRSLYEEFTANYRMQFFKMVSEGTQNIKNFRV